MAYLTTNDTIAAIASPSGGARRGVVRISGPEVVPIVSRCFQFDPFTDLSDVNRATRLTGNLRIGSQRLPGALLLWPDDRSYTRQPSAEFHTFGSTPLLETAVQELCNAGARIAEPGEFTLRAFLSGRMDLTQAEAVLAVIDAQSQKKLSVALEQLSGGLAGPLAETKQTLMNVLAELEAGLDFVEEDIEFIAAEQIIAALLQGQRQLHVIEQQIKQRGGERHEVKVVLSGLPNAGKSSLFNALLDSDQSIVTDTAGTTTDFVTASTEIKGIAVQLIDTAGLESGDDQSDRAPAEIMHTAQQQRVDEIENADLILICAGPDDHSRSWAIEQMERMTETGKAFLLVLTKSDLASDWSSLQAGIELKTHVTNMTGSQRKSIALSSHTGHNVEKLKFEISATAIALSTDENAVVGSTLLRSSTSLRTAAASIDGALEAAEGDFGQEIVAAEIRQSLDALGQIVGTVYNDDVLDLVFGRFCIGK